MSQINVNSPGPGVEPVETVDTSGDRTAAAGINLITVLIVIAVLAVIAWYLFTGPLRSLAGGTTNIQGNYSFSVPLGPVKLLFSSPRNFYYAATWSGNARDFLAGIEFPSADFRRCITSYSKYMKVGWRANLLHG